ncbi:MAG: cytochrome-c peroxidase [Bacteroidetes bacterium]|nr:MAG: cytochrome-c peroxidase [Bacteroidota bacterium]
MNFGVLKYYFGGIVILSLFLVRCVAGKENSFEVYTNDMNTPPDNPPSKEKIELGRKLFFDNRLSRDNSISCSSCHLPEFAFTDRKKVSEGVAGGMTERNAPSVLNSVFLKKVMFDAHLETLEMQAIVPIQEHVEMDMKMRDVIEKLKGDPYYSKKAKEIFNREFDAWVLTRSIAAFERSLVSMNSKFDQFQRKEIDLNESELNGWKLFSEKLYCSSCHPAPHFTTYKAENNGLYADYGTDKGRFRIHHDSMDIGKFKVPSLRNIELTYPYMHNGSYGSIEDVLDHYSKGGAGHWNQSSIIKPFKLSSQEKLDLVNFLKTLTDTSYMKQFR